MRSRFSLFLVVAVLFVTGVAAAVQGMEPRFAPRIVSQSRLEEPGLQNAILGALSYIEDTQIRNRPGRGHTQFDSTDEGDGARSEAYLNLPWKENIGLPTPPKIKIRNRSGEWASFIHFLPKRTGFHGRNLVSLQDSNLFMTAFIAFPLFMFDDSALPESRQMVGKLLPQALSNIASFKRDDAYNFWAVLPGVDGKAVRSGPFNIPVEFVRKLGQAFLNPKLDRLFSLLTRGMKTPPKFWVDQCLNATLNPTGADGLFNIPNDADDTAVAVAFQRLFSRRFPQTATRPDLAALRLVTRYRDLDRPKEDGRDVWKGKNTGAFMTWLKSEAQPTFDTPETGIIPLSVNNVDCVVNANVAFSLGMNRLKKIPGYTQCLNLLSRAVFERVWPDAGLYYPQYMIFPYSVSRAWREGNAREGEMNRAMEKLLSDLLFEQAAWARQHPERSGAFPGGEDRSDHLSTALGLCTLLNIGRATAEKLGITERYDIGVKAAVRHLLRVAKTRKPEYGSTIQVFPGREARVWYWESGLFFAASFWDLAHWRSEAYTVAMVLEGLTKYALAYDQFPGTIADIQFRLKDDPQAPFGVNLTH
jgi:hypothetical protein